MKYSQIEIIALAAVGIVLPLIGVYPTFLMQCWCFALFACAYNLLLGYSGLTSFGHAAFFGGAAYITGHCVKVLGFPPELGILAGTAFAGVLGFIIGSIAIRRQGIYFAMITLALAQMLYFVWVQLRFTGGEDGLQNVPRGRLFGLIPLQDTLTMYYLVFTIFFAGFLLIYRIINSPFGQVLRAIRENEPRALSLGYDVDRYKKIAFILSASLSGLAGATKTIVFQLASLTDAHWAMSGEAILMTLLGGVGTVFGPVVGAFLVVSLETQLASRVGAWVQVIMGVIFAICVISFRRGIVGVIQQRIARHRKPAVTLEAHDASQG
jgi:branched-chain amino acid transport system permease protein